MGNSGFTRAISTKIFVALLTLSVASSTLATSRSGTQQSNSTPTDFETRANSLIEAAFNIDYLSDYERGGLVSYAARALEGDAAVHPQRDDIDRILFAKGKSVKKAFNLPLATGHFGREENSSSADVSILPLSSRAILLQFFAYKLTTNNVTTCDVIARGTIDFSGVLHGRSIDDAIMIEGKVGRDGKSLQVQLHSDSDIVYPGCGVGLSLDGTYVSD